MINLDKQIKVMSINKTINKSISIKNNSAKNEFNDIKNRKDLELLVNDFYDKLLTVDELSFYFTKIKSVDMATHKTFMVNFWENILFHTGYYEGNPLEIHKNLNSLHKVETDVYKIWIELFNNSVDNLFKGINAEIVKERAKMVANVMQSNIL